MDDLKNYRAPVDAFQIIEEGTAGACLLLMVVFLLAFWSWFQ